MKKLIIAITVFAGIAAVAATVTIQNVLQIPYALESITGVSSRERAIAEYFQNNKSAFPKNGLIEEVNDTYLFSQLTYASHFCKVMVESDARLTPDRRWAHSQVDFAKPVAQWTQELKENVINEYAMMFWSRPTTPAEKTELLNLIAGFAADLPQTKESTTPILMSTCAIFGSSFSFLSL